MKIQLELCLDSNCVRWRRIVVVGCAREAGCHLFVTFCNDFNCSYSLLVGRLRVPEGIHTEHAPRGRSQENGWKCGGLVQVCKKILKRDGRIYMIRIFGADRRVYSNDNRSIDGPIYLNGLFTDWLYQHTLKKLNSLKTKQIKRKTWLWTMAAQSDSLLSSLNFSDLINVVFDQSANDDVTTDHSFFFPRIKADPIDQMCENSV